MHDDDLPFDGVIRTYRRGNARGADCASCPFARNGEPPHRPVVAEGPADDPAWIVVGEGPGHQEVQLGRPFIGPSGELVTKMLTQVRRDRSTVWITNATLCRPTPGATTEDKLAASNACRPRLNLELADLPPVPILALGAVAARTLLPTRLEGITELADTWHPADVDGTGRVRDVIPTIHPAAILRGGGEVKGAHAAEIGFWNLVYSAGKIESLARGRDIRFDFTGLQTEIADPARANALVAEAYGRALREKAVAIDLETYVDNEKRHDARQPFAAKIRVLGLATDEWACSVMWSLLSSNSKRLLGLLLKNPAIRKIGQNGIGYDRTVFKALGYEVDDAWDDTMLMHHVSFPGMSHKLQTIVSQFWAIEPWKSEYRASGDSDAEVTLYNAKDVLTTRALTAPLTLWIKRREVENVYELDRQCALIAGQMHLDGIPVDRGVNQEIATVLTEVIDRSLSSLREAVDAKRGEVWDRLALQQSNTMRKSDPPTAIERFHTRRAEIEKKASKKGWQFNPDAPLQVVALLQSLGLFLKKRSKSGKQPSTDAEVLEQFRHVPLVQQLIEYREREKIYGTFVLPMFDHVDDKNRSQFGHVQDDGRIHPTWAVHKITGRWGASNPMVQNWSKGDPMVCKACRAKLYTVGVDAYWHGKPKKGECASTNSIVPRSDVAFSGIPNIRSQVVAPPGRMFVGFDVAQQEARAIALVSGDEWLCDVFARGKDIHAEFAAVVWPNFWELDDVSRSILREGVKNAEYASFYEGSEETVHKTLIVKLGDPTISLAKTREMIAMMRSKMSGLISWKQRILNAIAKPPHEMRCLILNRLRAFPLAMFSPADVVNWGIQAFSAYMIKSGLVRIMPRIKKYRRRCFPDIDVHDAVIFECDEDETHRLTVDVKDCFEQSYRAVNGQEIPFPIETKVGKSWAEV